MSQASITVNRAGLGNALAFASLGLSRRPSVPVLAGMRDALHDEADKYARTAERNGTDGDALHAVRLRTIADRVAAGYQVKTEDLATA